MENSLVVPDAPKCCPACGETRRFFISESVSKYPTMGFECGTFYEFRRENIEWALEASGTGRCRNAFAAAVAAREELDAANRANEILAVDYRALNDLIGQERREHSDALAELVARREAFELQTQRLLQQEQKVATLAARLQQVEARAQVAQLRRMTPMQVDETEAGPELDLLIAKTFDIPGLRFATSEEYGICPMIEGPHGTRFFRPSADMTDAWLVWEKLPYHMRSADNCRWSIHGRGDECQVLVDFSSGAHNIIFGKGSAPLAICRAAYRAALEKR